IISQSIHPLHCFPPGLLPLIIDYVSVDGFIGTGEKGSGDGEFSGPSGIMMVEGLLYVADYDNKRIQVMRRDGTFVRKWTVDGYPRGVTYGEGVVFVTCSWPNDSVQVYGVDGTFIRRWGSRGVGDGQFFFPTGLVYCEGMIVV